MSKHKYETDGRESYTEPTTLDQLLGYNDLSKYGTLDEEEYKAKITEMHKTDLQAHASDLGFVPLDDVERLQANLLREFRNYVFYLRKPPTKKVLNKKPTKEVEKILADGR